MKKIPRKFWWALSIQSTAVTNLLYREGPTKSLDVAHLHLLNREKLIAIDFLFFQGTIQTTRRALIAPPLDDGPESGKSSLPSFTSHVI